MNFTKTSHLLNHNPSFSLPSNFQLYYSFDACYYFIYFESNCRWCVDMLGFKCFWSFHVTSNLLCNIICSFFSFPICRYLFVVLSNLSKYIRISIACICCRYFLHDYCWNYQSPTIQRVLRKIERRFSTYLQ